MGSVVISLDAELGWGFHDLVEPPSDRVEAGRRGWSVMLELLSEFDVPATWGVVGHLMLDSCDGTHAEHPAPDGWFERERTAWADRDDLRFGPDLVSAITESDVDHEFASHSFSHVLFGRPETDRELADAELERCRELAADWNQSLDSFIYPRNDVGHRDVLADHGITAYRGRSPTRDGVRGVFDSTIRDRSMLVEPAIDEHGLVDVPASMFLFGFEGPARTVAESIWEDPMVALARRGIDEATRSDGLFHMWLHPNNLTHDRDDRRMRAILSYLDRQRSATELTVETMTDVAQQVVGPAGDAERATASWN
ncbi:polysaccharide deacetylase family protein [Natrinema longum]|uniref:Polysaccharide deacetylase family protein n=1 Tax=Natrinema longum TaxID=370324 RepID=A0A8A2UCJ1_9EURY|nr:polysaccharide deacetylase family protein [Natrinema longum]MBZ6495737.1 polysaccharide deacetylase family protein [Natrinema longum]QSW86304.1 polysaccharide deacetylase family protein [Natrinema longum]